MNLSSTSTHPTPALPSKMHSTWPQQKGAALPTPQADVAAARLGHDLRSHLQALIAYLHLVKTFDKESERFERGMAGVVEAVEHMAERLNGHQPELIDLADFFQTEFKGFAQQCAPAVLEGPMKLEPGLRVRASRAGLRDAIGNLLRNARDSYGDRPGKVWLDAMVVSSGPKMPPQLPSGTFAVVRVSDSGRGMDRATLEAAGKDWFTLKGPGRGTGLGVAGVTQFACDAGGGLHLASALHVGSTASVWLPLVIAS